MLKIYNNKKQFLVLLDAELSNIQITDTLATGQRILSFELPCLPKYIQYLDEENYVETEDYNYIIKETKTISNNYISVYCSADIEEIKGKTFLYFDCIDKNLQQGYEYCIANTNWTVNYQSKDKTLITYQEPNVIAYDMIRRIAEDYGQEIWFDTKNKVMYVTDELGTDQGSYFSNEIQMKLLKRYAHTYDYATILYPFGKDGLTIEEINNGRKFIENYDYTDKTISAFFIDETIEVPEILMKKAQDHLNTISVPQASYEILLSTLNKEVSIGDTITIIDKIKKYKLKERVVKIIRYPKEPEKDKIEINNLMSNFFNMYIKGQKKSDNDIKYVRSLISQLE